MRVLLLVAAAGLAAGCQSTIPELRQDAREKIAFHIAAPYSVVRPNIENTIKHCHENASTGALNRFAVRSEQTASDATTITYWQEGLNNRPLYVVDVRSAVAGTDVTFYHGPYAIFSDYNPIVRGWAMGTGKCDGTFPAKPAVPPAVTPLPANTIMEPL